MVRITRCYGVRFTTGDRKFEPTTLVRLVNCRVARSAFILYRNYCLKKPALRKFGPLFWEHDGARDNHCGVVSKLLLDRASMTQGEFRGLYFSKVREYFILRWIRHYFSTVSLIIVVLVKYVDDVRVVSS